MSCEATFVLDTSLIIELKREVAANRQFELHKHMEELVEADRITFPPQVLREVKGQAHIDVPEAWVLAVAPKIKQPNNPSYDRLEEVMTAAPDLIEADAEGDPADPYVIALAMEVAESGEELCVVTVDLVDRLPIKISMKTACDRLAVPVMSMEDFLACMYLDLGWLQLARIAACNGT